MCKEQPFKEIDDNGSKRYLAVVSKACCKGVYGHWHHGGGLEAGV